MCLFFCQYHTVLITIAISSHFQLFVSSSFNLYSTILWLIGFRHYQLTPFYVGLDFISCTSPRPFHAFFHLQHHWEHCILIIFFYFTFYSLKLKITCVFIYLVFFRYVIYSSYTSSCLSVQLSMWSLPYLLSYQFSFKLSGFSLHLLRSSHPGTFLCCHSLFLFFCLGFLFQGFYSSSFLVYSIALRDHILQLFHMIEGMSGDLLVISCEMSASWVIEL